MPNSATRSSAEPLSRDVTFEINGIVLLEVWHAGHYRGPVISTDDEWWLSTKWLTYKVGINQLQDKGDFFLKSGFDEIGVAVPDSLWPLAVPLWAALRANERDKGEMLWCNIARSTVFVYWDDERERDVKAYKEKHGVPPVYASLEEEQQKSKERVARHEAFLQRLGIPMAWRDKWAREDAAAARKVEGARTRGRCIVVSWQLSSAADLRGP